MKRNMKQWAESVIASKKKKALPILSFPASQILSVSVKELVSDSALQAKGMQAIAARTPMLASVSLMDLSVEAEAFGSRVRMSEDEVPTVVGSIIQSEEDAEALAIPEIGAARTRNAIEAIRMAAEQITDRPVFAGMIGPYSLAGRLMDVSEIMILCYDEPEMVHTVLKKTTAFLIAYAKAFKEAGANGILMAEPLAGLLSPALAEEFSHPYAAEIVRAVQDEDFAVIYHNCGDNVVRMQEGIYGIGAAGYHFGDAIAMEQMLPSSPADALILGNLSPAEQLLGGTPASVREQTRAILKACGEYPNFVISSGCDIPPKTPWENLDAFFDAVEEWYKE